MEDPHPFHSAQEHAEEEVRELEAEIAKTGERK
jgi:hypothetical protein